MDFISIIIPAFNAERWIERTLLSVSEAIDKDCEVIIVNDGSTDDTRSIGMQFVDKDPRFILIDIKHSGPCAARKAGFLESQGEYIMFVDSDDLLPTNSISEQRHLLDLGNDPSMNVDNHPISDGRPLIVVANTVARVNNDDRLLINGSTRALTGAEYANSILKRELPGFLPGHLYARELLEAIEWDDSPEITHQENFYLLLSMAMKMEELMPGKRLVLVAPPVIGYYYMRRPGSQSSLMALTPKGLERVWRHINELGLPEPQLTLWGLLLIQKVFIERGIPFSSDYSVAMDLKQRALQLKDQLPTEFVEVVKALGSAKKRTQIAKRLAKTAGLTSLRPHLSVIIICNHALSKVERTVSSIFGMGFRNLETIIVDVNNTYSERVALNNIVVRYARVRIIKAEPSEDIYQAAARGFQAAEGLSVVFVRAGDICCPEGLYDAVTRIDYGADAVLTNYRDYHPTTHFKGKLHSFVNFRSTEESRNAVKTAADSTENVYHAVKKALEDSFKSHTPLFFYGIVWRTEYLRATANIPSEFFNDNASTLSHAFLRLAVNKKMNIVTQDANTGCAFLFVNQNLIKRMFQKLVFWRKKPLLPYVPTVLKH